MYFSDIHNHALAAVDDGARSDEMMYRMVDAAYADGIRLLCLTPHFHPISFGDNRAAAAESFQKLQSYVSEHCPQLKLYLGNELRYAPNCDSWLREGFCCTLGDTSLVLVDFSAEAEQHLIVRGLSQLLSMGYTPVLAHAERYARLSLNTVRTLVRNGIHIQLDVGSLTGCFGFRPRLQAQRLLRGRLVTLVGSDAHDLQHRPALLSKGYQITLKLTDKDYADRIFCSNAIDLLENNLEGLVREDE